MKIGILFEGKPTNPGGFNQSFNSALILNEINEYKNDFTFITLNNQTNKNLSNHNIRAILYNNNILLKIVSMLYPVEFIGSLLKKLGIKHPFTNFLKKNNFDIVIFLSPHQLSLYCSDIEFIINIWDLDHKKNSPYPEHNEPKVYRQREKLLNYVTFKAFKIIVAHEQNRNDLINFYKCNPDKILVQSFIPYLPTFFKKNKKKIFENKNNFFLKYNIPIDKKILFYPSTFWPHKNHQYILDTAKILTKNSISDFHFLFSGSDKGNYSYIKNEINKHNLDKLVTIIPFVTNEELIFFYQNIFGVVMPTFGGPTNLPLYESFFFKKPIFYTKNLLNDQILKNAIIEIDTTNPNDFFEKLINIESFDLEKVKSFAYKCYIKDCSNELFKKNYNSILNEFKNIILK